MNLTPSSSPSGSDVSENEISNIKNEIISIQNDVSELQQKSGHSGSSNSSKGIMPMYRFMLYSKYSIPSVYAVAVANQKSRKSKFA